MNLRIAAVLSAWFVLATSPAICQGTASSSVAPAERRALFGELHLHTTMSFDAWTFGTRVTPDEAYKFGQGQTVTVQGRPATRSWPLDFMAVTDHSEFMGALTQLDDPNNPFSKSDLGKQILSNPLQAFFTVGGMMRAKPPQPDLVAAAEASHAWDIEVKAANDNYAPGRFTTLIAYEWTSRGPAGENLHRNVFFNSDHAPRPFTSVDSLRPEDLWSYLESVR